LKSVVQIIFAFSLIYYGSPQVADWLYNKVQKISLEQVAKPMTSLSSISNGLTNIRLDRNQM